MIYIFYSDRWPHLYQNAIDDEAFHKLLNEKYKINSLDNQIAYIDYDNEYYISINNKKYKIENNDIIFASYCYLANFVVLQMVTGQVTNNQIRLASDLLYLKKQIGLKVYNDIEFVRFSNNKQAINTFCKKYNINYPSTLYIPNISILKQLNFNDLNFPIVVKKVSQSGAIGCVKVNNKTELFTIANMIFYTGQGIVIQEFIDCEYELRIMTIGKTVCEIADKSWPTEEEFRTRFTDIKDVNNKLLPDEIKFANYYLECLHKEFDYIAQIGSDVKRGKDGKLYLIEFNNLPGMVKYYDQFSDWIVAETLK